MAADPPADSRTPAEILAGIEQKLDRLLAIYDEFRPLLDAWRQAGGGTVGAWRAWRATRNGDQAPTGGRASWKDL